MQSFTELNLSAPVLQAIQDLGFETPSPIQAETLPILLAEPTDFLGLAATGTGKTAAFAIPMIERLDADLEAVQALILCPTRELAQQVSGQVNALGKHKNIRALTIYGGASYGDQFRGLREGAQVIVGTPGRVVDHLERGSLVLENLKMIIFDEADEMISMGFKDDLEKILAGVPRESSNFWLFSATMSPEVRRVSDQYLRSPKQVQLNKKEVLSAGIEQFYYPAQESNKPEILCKLIEAAEDFYGLIFCQTKSLVCDLTTYLQERGYKVDSLHGDKDQNSRERTMQAFRDRRARILVCTDVASRGLDVKDITHVINYSLPRELDNYVHRIGRTARSGKTGVAMNLVTYSHRHLIGQIERVTKSRMKEGVLPSRKEIATKKVSKLLPSFQEQTFQNRALEVMSPEWQEAIATMTPQEVAARFIAMQMPDLFNDRADERPPRLSAPKEDRAPRAARPAPRSFRGPDREASERPQRRFERGDSSERPQRRFDRSESSDRPQRRFDREDSSERPQRRFERSEPSSERPPRRFERSDREEQRPGRFDRSPSAKKPFRTGKPEGTGVFRRKPHGHPSKTTGRSQRF